MHASVAASWDARTTDVEGNWYASRISLFMTTMSKLAMMYAHAHAPGTNARLDQNSAISATGE